ncbi:hypothetical protein Bca4012_078244 [Brassica carinata]
MLTLHILESRILLFPSLHEVNRMIARSEEEVELFDQMDEEFDWTEEMTCHEQVPKWLRASTREVNAIVADLSKKPSKNMLSSSNLIVQTGGPGDSDDSSAEKNIDSGNEEEGDLGQFDDDELTGAVVIKKSLHRMIPVLQNLHQKVRDRKRWLLLFLQKKFGSLSAFDTRRGSVSKRLENDLEDGEIGASGDSHRDLQRSYDRDEGGG